MKIMNVVTGLIAAGAIMASCSDSSPTTVNEDGRNWPSNEGSIQTTQWPTSVTANEQFPSHARDCTTPAKNCLDGKPVLDLPPGGAAQIVSLENAISGGTQSSFFSTPGNFDKLWLNTATDELTDLKNGAAVLVIVPASTDSMRIYALMDPTTGEAMDYSTP